MSATMACVIDVFAEWVLTVEDEHGVDHDPERLPDEMRKLMTRAGVTWYEVDRRANELYDARHWHYSKPRADLPQELSPMFMGQPTYARVGIGSSACGPMEWVPASGATGPTIVGGDTPPPGYVEKEFKL